MLSKIVQESVESRKTFVQQLSGKIKYFCAGQYIEDSPEMLAYKDGVTTAIGMMTIDLLGGVKEKGMLEQFKISSQISLLEAFKEENERLYNYITGDSEYERGKESAFEEIDILLQEQIELIKKMV